MFSFISRRVLAGLATLLVSTFAMYLLVDAAIRPYIFADLESSTKPNKAELIAQRTADLDLDTPSVIRYFKWLGDFVTGDLGTAWQSGQSVSTLLQAPSSRRSSSSPPRPSSPWSSASWSASSARCGSTAPSTT